MPADNLILFQKTYDFLLWFYVLIQKLPKRHRTVLGRQLEELALSILLLELSANRVRDEKRHTLQLTISHKLEQLRILIRLTKDLRFISIKQYSFAAKQLNELGKILSGWIKVTTSSDMPVKNIK